MMQKNIKIAGAGISGLVAAILLRRAGFEVSVFEKLSDCGMRFHGDWEGLDNWSTGGDMVETLRGLGIEVGDIVFPLKRFFAFSAYREFTIDSPKPIWYMVKRGKESDTLDQRLKSIALQVGVKIYFNSPVVNLSNDIDIVATGPGSRESGYVALGVNFATDLPDMMAIRFDTRNIPHGYAYLGVFNSQATLDIGGPKGGAVNKNLLGDTLEFFQGRFGDFATRGKRIFGSWGIIPFRPVSNEKPLFLGEAAGLQDNLFGFGMGYAIKSAAAAARHFTGGPPYRIFLSEMEPTITATRIWSRIIFGAMKNPGIHFLCLCAQKNALSLLRFLYRPTLITKIAAPLL